MKFNKYPKFTNAYKDEFVFKVMETVPYDTLWYVTEKIHGANFQITGGLDDKGEFIFKVGSRNSFTDMSFFNLKYSEPFISEYSKVVELIKELIHNGYSQVTVYGEVYGGNIQKGVFYSDEKRFRAFDIFFDGEFLVRNAAIQMFDKYEVDYCTTIMQGNLLDCLTHANDFDSLIDAELTQEEVREGNICEGVVIRPVIPLYTNKGEFIAIKNKNDKWSEKSRLPKVRKDYDVLPSKLLDIYNKMDQYVTDNTVNSAISKIGREMKFIPELMKELNTDIINSVMNDNKEFELKGCKLIARRFNKRLITMVKKEIQNYQV